MPSALVTGCSARTTAESLAAIASETADTATAIAGTWHGRVVTRQASAPRTGTASKKTIRYSGPTSSAPQGVKPVGVGHPELAADMEDCDAHHEHRDECVEQNAQFDEERRFDNRD